MLRYLELRVNAMIEIWNLDGTSPAKADPTDDRPDAHLLNGPQPRGHGVSQDDVDKLFDEAFSDVAGQSPESNADIATNDADQPDAGGGNLVVVDDMDTVAAPPLDQEVVETLLGS